MRKTPLFCTCGSLFREGNSKVLCELTEVSFTLVLPEPEGKDQSERFFGMCKPRVSG